jgi:Tfp pilus assembly protein PilO
MDSNLQKFIGRNLLIAALIIAGAWLVSYFVLNPLVDAQVAKHQMKESEYIAIAFPEYEAEVLKADYQQIKPKVDQIYATLPEEDDIFKVIDQLEKIAAEVGLDQTTDVSANVEEYEGLSVIPVSVELRGQLDGLIEYLKRVENLRYFIQEKSIEYDKRYVSQEGAETVGINANLKLLIYLKPSE